MSALLDDQVNSVINCLIAKSTWDDLILFHEVPFDVKESRVMYLKLYNTFKFKEDSPNDKEVTRSSHEYLNDLEEEYQARDLLARSKSSFQHKPELRPTKDIEAKYNKVKAKLALLSSSTSSSKVVTVKNKGLITKAYAWDEEELSSDDNEMVEVKVHMELAKENNAISKEGLRNDEWVKISMKKHVNTEILKKNKNLRTELKEITAITKTWLNSSNKVNQCISEQTPSQKNRILRVDQLTEDPFSSRKKDLLFVKSSADDTKVSIPGVERPWLSKAEGFILPNHDTATDYDSADESLVFSTPHPPLKKLDGVEPVSRPKTIKSILKLKSTFKAKNLKRVITNDHPQLPPRVTKAFQPSKVNSALAGKLKSVKIKNDPPLDIVMKELNDLKLQIIKNQSSYSRNNQPQQVPQNALQNKYKTQFKRSCDLCGLNNHLSENCYKVLFCKKCERTDQKTCDHAEYISTINMSQHLKSLGRSSSRSKYPRPSKHFFPPCIHCGFSDHLSNDCVNYPICDICGSYDHDIHGHNRIISLRRGIKPKNPKHVMKSYETCSSTVHTTSNHNDIEWFRRDLRLSIEGGFLNKTNHSEGPKVVFGDDSTCTTEGYISIKCNGIVFTKVAFVNGLKYNLISISELCDAKYIVQFDEKKGTIFNSNKEAVMIAPRVRDVYVLDMTSSAPESCFFAKVLASLFSEAGVIYVNWISLEHFIECRGR
uniref:Retrovirus-related Pol polyprotein from transposon TNT 1-94 n=1 Tax=Tanacetum cinerariifolium TaxID=118510 RepID=A0A699GM38_TANCI|nr:retrovirus-related Pol polyprotein from transposon TNT 1-94 [Tanacetum cinerariifolium]